MAAPVTVPVEVTPDATARIEELGMRREFEKMIEYTKKAVDDLQSIDVTVYDDPYEPGEPRMVIRAWREGCGTVDDPSRSSWVDWYVKTFAPDVRRWFSFEIDYGTNHGR